LPQAKIYRQSCSIGPAIHLAAALTAPDRINIRMRIHRGGTLAFEGSVSLSKLARKLTELVDWLFRENEFPSGVMLLTGTGIVPPDDFTLWEGDIVEIDAEEIGTLINPVTRG